MILLLYRNEIIKYCDQWICITPTSRYTPTKGELTQLEAIREFHVIFLFSPLLLLRSTVLISNLPVHSDTVLFCRVNTRYIRYSRVETVLRVHWHCNYYVLEYLYLVVQSHVLCVRTVPGSGCGAHGVVLQQGKNWLQIYLNSEAIQLFLLKLDWWLPRREHV